jgi:hypothetical protein
VHLVAAQDELVAVYRDESLVYAWSDQDVDTPWPVLACLPAFSEAVAQVVISRDFVWLLTTRNQVSYLSKEAWLDSDSGKIARIKAVPNCFPLNIAHMCATWSEVYFFCEPYGGQPHRRLACDHLPTLRGAAFGQELGGIWQGVDPHGLSGLGFEPGDEILDETGEWRVVGSTSTSMVVLSPQTMLLREVPLPTLDEALQDFTLIGRVDGEIVEVDVPVRGVLGVRFHEFPGRARDADSALSPRTPLRPDDLVGDTESGSLPIDEEEWRLPCRRARMVPVQLDAGSQALLRVCDFRAGDVVETADGQRATVLGERAGRLWLRCGDQVLACAQASREALHSALSLRSRRDSKMATLTDPDGCAVLVEIAGSGVLQPGDLVSEPTLGLGTMVGVGSGATVAVTLSDQSPTECRILTRGCLRPVRTARSTWMNVRSATGGMQQLSTCCADAGVYFVVGGEVVVCVGRARDGTIWGESERAVIADLGACPFDMSKAQRIGIPKMTDGGFFPLDVVIAGQLFCEVLGDGRLQVLGSGQVESDKAPELVYRRVNVGGGRLFSVSGSEILASVATAAFRGEHCRPYDVVEWRRRRVVILAVASPRKFVVADFETRVLEIAEFLPLRPPRVLFSMLE